ncbi:hypothetical protein D3C78_1541700 [compost metagenome]
MTKDAWASINRSILDRLMAETKQVLEARRQVFVHSLETLMREETLGGDEFRQLLDVNSAA